MKHRLTSAGTIALFLFLSSFLLAPGVAQSSPIEQVTFNGIVTDG